MFGIYPKSYQEILSILEECSSIDEVVIYGSRVKGNYRESSDIDITLKGDISKEDVNKLWQKLDDSFISYKFDISVYNRLKSENLLEDIDRVGETFYKREKIN